MKLIHKVDDLPGSAQKIRLTLGQRSRSPGEKVRMYIIILPIVHFSEAPYCAYSRLFVHYLIIDTIINFTSSVYNFDIVLTINST